MRSFIVPLFAVVLAVAACGGLECAIPGSCVEGEGDGAGDEEDEELGDNEFQPGCEIGALDISTCADGAEIMQADCDDGDRFEVQVRVDIDTTSFGCLRNGETFTVFENATLCDLDINVPADRTQAIIRLREGCNGDAEF